MSDGSALEKFRQRLERGLNEYRLAGGRLHSEMQGPLANLNTLCEGMAFMAGRDLRPQDCHVDREVMPYNLGADSFVVRHRFFRQSVHTDVDVTFSTGHVAYAGNRYSIAEMAVVEEAIVEAVLSFYLPE